MFKVMGPKQPPVKGAQSLIKVMVELFAKNVPLHVNYHCFVTLVSTAGFSRDEFQ